LNSYKNRYDNISLERNEQGVLLVTMHDFQQPTKSVRYHGRKLGWEHIHTELSHCFYDIARDYDNEVVILTGAGENFIGEQDGGYYPDAKMVGVRGARHPDTWDWVMADGIWLQMNLLNIDVPVIAAINGEAVIHAELALQSDIVLAS